MIRAALDSLANVEITAGRYSECRILFEETARRARADAGARPHWDAISELASRSRLAIAERNLKGAIDDLSDAIKLANDFGDNLSEIRLRIRRARALGLDAQSEAATKDVIKASIGAPDATTVAEGQTTLSRLFEQHKRTSLALRKHSAARFAWLVLFPMLLSSRTWCELRLSTSSQHDRAIS